MEQVIAGQSSRSERQVRVGGQSGGSEQQGRVGGQSGGSERQGRASQSRVKVEVRREG